MPNILPMPPQGETILAKTILSPKVEPVVETPPVEAPTQSELAPKPEITAETSPQDAMRIAASIRREKALRKQTKDLEDEKRRFEAEKLTLEPWKEAMELAKTDKLAALKKIGIAYEDVTNQILNNGAMPPELVASHAAAQTAQEIINKRLEEFEKKQLEKLQVSQTENYAQSIKQIDSEVQSIVDGSDKYLLVKEAGAYHDVTEFIEKEFHRIGIILPIEAAIEKVEQEIAEGVLSLAKIDKIKSQLLSEAPKTAAPLPQVNPKTTTLTNKTMTTPPSGPPKRLTDAERRQRAIAVIQGVAV